MCKRWRHECFNEAGWVSRLRGAGDFLLLKSIKRPAEEFIQVIKMAALDLLLEPLFGFRVNFDIHARDSYFGATRNRRQMQTHTGRVAPCCSQVHWPSGRFLPHAISWGVDENELSIVMLDG